MALSAKQQMFVNAYLQCWNASEAVRRAGYIGKANVIGARMLANVSIQAEIQRRLAEHVMSADEVLARLGQHARGDIRDFIRFTPTHDFRVDLGPDKPLHLIKKIVPTKYGDRIEFHDPQKALELLARHYGLLKELDPALIAAEVERQLVERDTSQRDSTTHSSGNESSNG